MKRLLFTVFLWAAALHAQGRMMGNHSPAPQPARTGPLMASRPAPAVRSNFSPRPPMPSARMSSAQNRLIVSTGGRRVFTPRFGFRQPHQFRHHRVFFANSNCFNVSAFDPFICSNGFAYPYYPLYPSDYSASTQQQPQYVVSNDNSASDGELALQMQRLADEVELMRDQERSRNREQTAEPSKPDSSSSDPASSRTLVFRDGHQLLVEN